MLPEAFLLRMQNQLKEEYSQYLESLERPRAVALRFNPLRTSSSPLPFLKEPVPWEPLGYYYDPAARPGLHPYHEAGVYYLQEASAMSAVALLEPQPGEIICDLCAAPGGKSTQIAGRLMGEGMLLCNEFSSKRAKILSQNIERLGIANAVVTNETPARLAQRYPGFFDRVLVDAPCSGEGMFRKEEAAVADWSQETVEMCARRQAEILEAAALLVRPGGRLVYSTCTFAPEEDELAVEAFLRAHPEFAPEAVSAPWFTEVAQGRFRLWPHKLLGEGHFAAVLRKMAGSESFVPAQEGARLPKCAEAFLKELKIALPEGKALSFGDTWYWAPKATPEIAKLKVLRPGLELGQVKKDRFEPAHALAMSGLKMPCVSFSADSQEVKDYLHGLTIPSAQKGWLRFCVDGYPLGWAKGDGTQLKNHYPKGLRR